MIKDDAMVEKLPGKLGFWGGGGSGVCIPGAVLTKE